MAGSHKRPPRSAEDEDRIPYRSFLALRSGSRVSGSLSVKQRSSFPIILLQNFDNLIVFFKLSQTAASSVMLSRSPSPNLQMPAAKRPRWVKDKLLRLHV